MPSKTEGSYAEEAIISEANGYLSRELLTIISGQNLKACAALGKITASGKYTALAPGAGDGSQTFAGMLLEDCDASGGDKKAAVLVRYAELNQGEIGWNTMNGGQITTAISQALALGISVRGAI